MEQEIAEGQAEIEGELQASPPTLYGLPTLCDQLIRGSEFVSNS